MNSNTIRTSVVVAVALLAFTTFAIFGMGAVAASEPAADDPYNHSVADTTVDPAIEGDAGTVEAIVTLESADRGDGVAMAADEISPLEQPLHTFAQERDGVTVLNRFWIADAVLVEIDRAHVDVHELGTVDHVAYVGANNEVEPLTPGVETDDGTTAGVSAPSEPTAPQPTDSVTQSASVDETAHGDVTYGLDQINAPDVWTELNTQGEGSKIAVLDTGIEPDHPDLDLFTEDPDDPRFPGGWAEFDDRGAQVESVPYDHHGHGTHVSGTVAGGDASGTHIGVAPETTLIHGGVLTPEGGTEAAVLAGMQWAVEEDADVISMSLGAQGYQPAMVEAVRGAEAEGTLVIAAIGNSGEGTSGSPGNVYDTLSAGASDEQENIAPFSSGEEITTAQAWGDAAPDGWPDTYVVPSVSAPGVNVVSAVPGDQWEPFDGTSMAAPHVSGTAALMIAHEDRSVTELKVQLEETAQKPDGAPDGRDTRYGSGIIDAYAATAAGGDNPAVSLRDVAVEPGGETTVDLTTEAENVAGYETTIAYDPSLIQIDGVAEGDLESVVTNIDNEEGTVTLAAAGATGVDEPVLAGLELSVDPDADLGARSPLQITHTELVSPAGDDILAVTDSGSVIVADDPVELSLSDAAGDPGSTVSATLAADNSLAGYDTTITFDPTVVQFDTATGGEFADPATRVDNDAGVVRIAAAEAADVESPVLADLEFTVVGDGGDQTPLAFDADATTTVDAAGNELVTITEDGEVVATGDDVDEALFATTDLEPGDTTVTEGDTIEIAATVTNLGNADATQSVEFQVDGVVEDAEDVTLQPDEATTVTTTYTADEPGTYTYGVSSDDDDVTATLTVEEAGEPAADFAVDNLDPVEETIQLGEAVDVEAAITNDGDAEGTQEIELRLDNTTVENESVTLDADEQTTVTFEEVQPAAAGQYIHGIYSANDSAVGVLTVEDDDVEQDGLNITLEPTTGEVAPGEEQTYDIVVEGADEGISAYEMSVTIDDIDVGQFSDYEHVGDPLFNQTELTPDTVAFEVGMGDDVFEPNETITIASVTAIATGDDGDSTTLTFDAEAPLEVRDTNDLPYEIRDTTGGSLEVSDEEELPEIDVTGNGEPATDTTGDGLLNDIDGDGEFDIFDVQALYNNLDNEDVQENAAFFKFSDPDAEDPEEVDIFDVQALYNDLD